MIEQRQKIGDFLHSHGWFLLSQSHIIWIYVCTYYNILLGLQQSIEVPVSTPVATNTQSLLSSDQQHHSLSPSKYIRNTIIIYVYISMHITYIAYLITPKFHGQNTFMIFVNYTEITEIAVQKFPYSTRT